MERLLEVLRETEGLLKQAEKNLEEAQELSKSSLNVAEQVKARFALLVAKHAETEKILTQKKEAVLKILAQISVLFGNQSYSSIGFFRVCLKISAKPEIKISLREESWTIPEFLIKDDDVKWFYDLCFQIRTSFPRMALEISRKHDSHKKEIKKFKELFEELAKIDIADIF
jgi:hypothetical protein